AAGARWFAVSTAEEGVALREAGIGANILLMSDSLAFSWPALVEYRLTPVLLSLEDLRQLDRCAAARGVKVTCHLKLDTGMTRVGTLAGVPEIAAAIRAARHLELGGIMSHFASPEDFASDHADRQAAAFESAARGLERLGIVAPLRHMASSNAIAYGRLSAFQNMARAGIALYGYLSPTTGNAPRAAFDVKPALAWKAAVLMTKDVPAGSAIGYGALFRALRPMRIAVIGAGYADGVPHCLSNRGRAIAGGRVVPFLGAVSMDVTTIDVTDCPQIQAGSTVTLLGTEGDASLDAQQIAAMAGTISYDVLCGIRPRVKRVYSVVTEPRP
ncbi:MAG TPA: alanine racemase, partial [Bryobacteraceae bacterium]|nr:alanine racemase [Bryobacteraceae bacterium]